MKLKRLVLKLAVAFALAVGLYHVADAAAPAPALTTVFNNASAITPKEPAVDYRLPELKAPTAEEAKELWRIRVGAWLIGGSGHHTFLEFSPYSQTNPELMDQRNVYQVHGIATDEVRHTWAQLYYLNKDTYTRYMSGDYVLKGLGVVQDHHRKYFQQRAVAYVDVYYGTKEDVLKKYLDAMQVAKYLNSTNDPYNLLRHNSNSAQRTYADALGLPQPPLFVAHRYAALGGRLWAPGVQHSLLPPGWSMEERRENSDYKDFTTAQLEERARALAGEDKMFATFRTPKPKGPG